MTLRIGLVGIGAIARNQHARVIAGRDDVELVAAASRNATLDGVANHPSIEAMLDAHPEIEAVSLTAPPAPRYAMARHAIGRGKHVMLEKPPGATLSEVEELATLARDAGVTLHATWHSRHAPAIEPMRERLAGAEIRAVDCVWRESVRRWHPGQEWIWRPGGFGVLDPGINALSILTRVLPEPFRCREATLRVPENAQTPIAVDAQFALASGAPLEMRLDWREEGEQVWDVTVDTDAGSLMLREGGALLLVDGEVAINEPEREYHGVYDRFVELIRTGRSEVDVSPLRHVADVMMLGARESVEAFEW